MDSTDMSQLASQLSDKDKIELRAVLTQETQRAQIQQQTHELTKLCWKSCMTGSVRGGKLEKNEETCLASCVERFLDVNHLTIKHLEKMRH